MKARCGLCGLDRNVSACRKADCERLSGLICADLLCDTCQDFHAGRMTMHEQQVLLGQVREEVRRVMARDRDELALALQAVLRATPDALSRARRLVFSLRAGDGGIDLARALAAQDGASAAGERRE